MGKHSSNIRAATIGDLPAIFVLERSSPTAAHWKESDYRTAIAQPERLVLIAERETSIVGFLVASVATEEWELENIAVSPAAFRQGIGRALMNGLINRARQAQAAEIRQEIRASNITAQKLGLSAGFIQEGRRRVPA